MRNSPSLPPEVKERLLWQAGSRAAVRGVLILEASRYRPQEQNRLDATQRLVSLVQQALEKSKKCKATRLLVASKTRRPAEKNRRGRLKRLRRYSPEDWE